MRAQLIDQRLGRERARLVSDGLNHQLAPASQPQAFFVEPTQHPLGA
jgi:hypothetical protein